MTPRYLRKAPSRTDTLAAALLSGTLAAGIGLVTFYFVRLLLSRDPISEAERPTNTEAEAVGLSGRAEE
jgi:hypothetical protein